MTAPAMTPYRPAVAAGRDGFGQVLRAEWTKFRTVRGWLIGVVVAAVVMIALGLVTSGAAQAGCRVAGGGGQSGSACGLPSPTLGPGGEPVTDSFYFVHQPLAGNGSITTELTSFTGRYGAIPTGPGAGPGPGVAAGGQGPQFVQGLQPWSKAGIIIKASTRPGSAYAAVLLTGGHGVRFQDDYTGDVAGAPGGVSAASPRWLRLTRSGDVITGYQSTDGSHWTRIGAATLAGLPATVQAGLFVASPDHTVISLDFGGQSTQGSPSQATAVFGQVSLPGGTSSRWAGTSVGGSLEMPGGYRQAGGMFTLTGSGDIAPLAGRDAAGPTMTIEQPLVGGFAGLIALAVVAAMFITVEYRRGLIRTTLAASPRRGRVLAAKAIVTGSVVFVAMLAAAAVCVLAGTKLASSHGFFVYPVTWLTELRVIVGTAALLAVAAVLALAVGAMVRRSAAAIAAVIVAIVLPYILAVAGVLPVGAADWLLRLTPAAGFAIEQSLPAYPQVHALYAPGTGYFPLSPWAGFAVLCGYAAAALLLSGYLLRRRDA